jgi:hypothetical protein
LIGVANAFKAAASKQPEQDRMDTQGVIAILEEKARRSDGERCGPLILSVTGGS